LTCAVIIVRDRRKAVAPLAAGAAVLGPWLVFSQLYFGTIIPHTVIAKDAIRFVDDFRWMDQARWLAAGWLAFTPMGPALGLVAGLALIAAGAIALRRTSGANVVVPLLLAFQLIFAVA